MQTIQNALLDYARNNKYLSPLLKFSSAMAVIYPVYLIVSRLSFLDFAWKYIGMISAVMYIAYFAGTVLCFARNKLIPLDIAYSCMAVNYMLGLQYGVNLNRIVYIAFYGLIAGICIVATKNSTQWAQFKASTFNKAAKYAEVAGEALSSKGEDDVVCPKCGNKCNKDMKFCNNCGNPINQ